MVESAQFDTSTENRNRHVENFDRESSREIWNNS